MFGLYMSSLYNYKLLKPVNFIIIVKLKYITYNNLTKSLLIDNSLKKDLEMGYISSEVYSQTKCLVKHLE